MTTQDLADMTRRLTDAELAELVRQRDKLLAFKHFVHDRLTAAGVPTHPDGPHSAEGCRIGDRLDIALADFRSATGCEGKYGTIYTTGKRFHPHEPVFILRATDINAPGAIALYAAACLDAECSDEHVQAAINHAIRVRRWQQDNPLLVKQPD